MSYNLSDLIYDNPFLGLFDMNFMIIQSPINGNIGEIVIGKYNFRVSITEDLHLYSRLK